VRLQSAADERRYRGDGDDGAAAALGGHLPRGGLAGVEGAVEVGADCGGEEVVVEVQELRKPTDPRVTNKDIQRPKLPHRRLHEQLPRLGLAHIALYLYQPPGFRVPLSDGSRFGDQGGDVVRVRGEIEVVDGDVAALPQVFQGDRAADSRGAARDGRGEGGEEVVLGHGFALCLFCLFAFFFAPSLSIEDLGGEGGGGGEV